MSKMLKVRSKHFDDLVKELGKFTAQDIKKFASQEGIFLPSADVIEAHLGGDHDAPKRNPEAIAVDRAKIREVMKKMGPDRFKRAEMERTSPAAKWKLHHETLKANRHVLSYLMGAYYGVHGDTIDERSIFEPDAPIFNAKEIIRERYLKHIRLGGVSVSLLMKPTWVPDSLIPLNQLDQKKTFVEHSIPNDLEPDLANNLMQYCGIKADDNPSYHLVGDSVDNGVPALSFYKSSYHRYQNSCEALSWELARAFSDFPPDFRPRPQEPMQLYSERIFRDRKQIQRVLNERLESRRNVDPFAFKHRSVGVGINTITVVAFSNPDKQPRFLLHKRGSGTAALGEAIGTTHVIPAGTFQPLCTDYDKDAHEFEFSFEHNVMREFAEELLNKEELIRHWAPEFHPADVYTHTNDPDLPKVKAMFDQGYIQQYFLGCGLDLVSLKFEMMSLLIVHGDKYRAENLKLSGSTIEGELADWPTFTEESLKEKMTIANLLPAGAGCIALSFYRYNEILARIQQLLKKKG